MIPFLDSLSGFLMRVCRMRSGISITLTPTDRSRLDVVIGDRNSPQKHVWRCRIVQLSADGGGTHAIMAATGKSKTCVWRWQERFMHEGVDGLLRDKTRPPGTPPVEARRLSATLRRGEERNKKTHQPHAKCSFCQSLFGQFKAFRKSMWRTRRPRMESLPDARSERWCTYRQT